MILIKLIIKIFIVKYIFKKQSDNEDNNLNLNEIYEFEKFG